MPPISIMQGRLSPAENGRFQFFPTNWPGEFKIAQDVGLDGICWFLDVDKPNLDPIKDIWGNQAILEQIDQARKIVPIRGMDTGRYGFFGPEAERTVADFKILLPALAPRLTGGVLSIPLLEDKFPQAPAQQVEVANNLRTVANLAATLQLRLALETEWPAAAALTFLTQLNSPQVGICYDIGNATSYGFDCPNEIRQLGQHIFDVHLKDRQIGQTQSLLLGTGDANFTGCFRALKEIDYDGGFTLQAWRGDNYLNDARKQLIFIKQKLV